MFIVVVLPCRAVYRRASERAHCCHRRRTPTARRPPASPVSATCACPPSRRPRPTASPTPPLA